MNTQRIDKTIAKQSVLVVEDSVDLLAVMQDQLEEDGYEVFPATHGKQAIDFLTASQGRRPDLVVIDLMMPIMNGWEVLDEMKLRPQLDTVPVLVITGVTATKPARAATLLLKPFSCEDFLVAVRATRRNPPSGHA